ncbi:hypothetical protein MLD38_006936 [Melastoma candidum]|uniref:Uncharacterized protein n=1 Tax=Melastoma candidum TaxID=119954 RepID=A0ACB9RP65_9MYRT|nr:hypothetical protein MLD38_006936 [Melastoma candidum]
MEVGKGKDVDEVVVMISPSAADREARGGSQKLNLELLELENLRSSVQGSGLTSSPSPTAVQQSPNYGKPPKMPTTGNTLSSRASFARSSFSKPKSRFVEPAYPGEAAVIVGEKSPLRSSPNVGSPYNNVSNSGAKDKERENLRSAPITPRTPLIVSPAVEDEEDDEEVYKTANLRVKALSGKKIKKMVLFEWLAFVIIVAILVASLTGHRLLDEIIWGLRLWKWCVLVLVVFCGRLVTEWLMNILVFLIEKNFLLKKKVLYFVYGLKKSVQAFIWLGLVLVAWGLLINSGVKRSRNTTKIINYVTRGLASCLIGAGIWLLKTLLIKILASSFQCTRFFDRIQESLFHQYVVRVLSGPPLMELAEKVNRSASSGRLSFKKASKGKSASQEEVIDVERLHKMKPEKISAWTMRNLMDVISGSKLSTLAGSLDRSVDDDEEEQQDQEITNEWEAKAAAYQIFSNVAKPGSKYIEEEDLLRFMKNEEVDNVLSLFEGAAATRKIKRKALKTWLVNVYLERKSLAHSLNDTKTAIEELNKLSSAILLVVIIVIWLLLMGFMTTKVLVFISSQLLLVVFMFGNTAKMVFEAIIFVFVMHPFDVGDRCVIDGVQMVVEEMNILTTVLLRYDNEKIIYPNSVLATKPISNFYRSPEMSDSVEFSVNFSTSAESIAGLKAKIKTYIESKPQYWRPAHSIQVKDIENVDKLKMALYINHTINFQNSGDRGSRRSELVLELKRILEELGIKYDFLPQEVHLRNFTSNVPR